MADSRVQTVTGATVDTEIIAPITTINFDPDTEVGSIVFNMSRRKKINGSIDGVDASVGALTMDIGGLLTQTFTVTNPDNTTTTLTGIQIMTAFEQVFDAAFNAQYPNGI